MKLLHNPASPFVRKVMVLLHETGQLDDVEVVGVKTSPYATHPEVKAANPLGKIPCLVRDDGPALYDSRVICRYLDARAGGKLYPKGEALWSTLALEATGEGMTEAALLCVYEGRLREESKRSEEFVAAQKAKIESGMAALEKLWMAHLAGPLDMGQVAVGAAIGYVEFRLTDWDWRAHHPALAAWYDGFSRRPSMTATAPHD
ncbi:glutathione S-transferase [bacterium]|nr:glutathione S-transferase [bacterium]